jgi:hypothetical protein
MGTISVKELLKVFKSNLELPKNIFYAEQRGRKIFPSEVSSHI